MVEEVTNPVRLRLIPYNARLVDARKAKGWTQKYLALLTGLTTSYMGHIETLRMIPSQEVMDEICDALMLPKDYLFPESLMEALHDGLFEHRVAELEEQQLIRFGEGRRAGLLPQGIGEKEALEAIEESIYRALLKEDMSKVLGSLKDRERRVLELRFGLKDGIPRTLKEVGKEFNLGGTRIGQIEAKALRLLRHPNRSRHLKGYLHKGD